MEEEACALELSSWPLNVQPSPTMAIKIMADKLKREGNGAKIYKSTYAVQARASWISA